MLMIPSEVITIMEALRTPSDVVYLANCEIHLWSSDSGHAYYQAYS